MARKPAAALPDVFAKPGNAPGRGTAIEDLPQPPPDPPPPPPPPEPEPAVAVHVPEPEPVASPPPLLPAEPQDGDPWTDGVTPPPAPASGRRAVAIAVIAIVVAVTAPYWEGALLSLADIRTPVERLAEQNVLAITQQEQRTADISQRLTAATAQIAKLQSELVGATQRAQQAATLTSTIALVRLSDTLRRPVPFAAELAVVRASGANLGDMKPLLDQIEPYAGTGIPGEAQLQRDYTALANQVTRGGGLLPTDWVSNLAIWARLRGPAPPPPPAEPSIELLRVASARLSEGDLASALEQVRQLDDRYKPLFASWVEDAQARVAAETLADKVSDMVAKALRQPAK